MLQCVPYNLVILLFVAILPLCAGRAEAGPLHDAAYLGNATVVQRLIEEGECVKGVDDDQDTSLHIAVRNGRLKVAALLIENGADPNVLNAWGESSLSVALLSFRKEVDMGILALLLKGGADPNLLTWTERAVFIGLDQEAAVFRMLKEHGLSPKADLMGLLAKSGRAATVKLLLEGDGGVALDPKAYDALRDAAAKGRIEVVEAISMRTIGRGREALDEARWSNNYSHFKKMLERGADPNGIGSSGSIPLIQSEVQRKRVEYVQLLIDFGANVNVAGSKQYTPLHIAVQVDSCEMIQLLVQNGADMSLEDKYGRTPIELAKGRGKKELIDCLVELGSPRIRVGRPNPSNTGSASDVERNNIGFSKTPDKVDFKKRPSNIGSAVLSGGDGDNVFIFGKEGGAVTITDFNPAGDKIGFSGANAAADLKVTTNEGNTIILYGDTTIVLNGREMTIEEVWACRKE